MSSADLEDVRKRSPKSMNIIARASNCTAGNTGLVLKDSLSCTMGQLHKLPLLFLYFFIYSFFRNSCLLCYCHLFDYSFSGDRFDILFQILDGFDTIIIHRQQDLIKYEIKVSQRMVTDDYAPVTSTAEIYEQVFHDMKLAKINGNTKKVRYV